MMIRVLLWLLAAIATGIVLVLGGLRGKRLNDHPVCRQCRFDLSGSPEGTITCPECGAGLKRPGSTRIGQRRKRPIAIAIGAAAIFLPLAALVTSAWAMLTGQSVQKWVPLRILILESRLVDAVRQQSVGAEALRRYNAKSLDADQTAELLGAALDLQADTRRPWAEEWGDLVEAVHSDGKLPPAQLSRFRTQSALVAWKVRPRVRAGDPIPVIIDLAGVRVGAATSLQAMVWHTDATIDGAPTRRSRVPMDGMILGGMVETGPNLGWFQIFGKNTRFGWPAPWGQAKLLVDCPKTLPPGPHTLHDRVAVQTRAQNGFNGVTLSGPPKNDPDTRILERDLSFEVLAPGSAGIDLVTPSAAAAKSMEQGLSPSGLHVWRYRSSVITNSSSNMQFAIDSLPQACAFDVFWRAAGQEWRVGSFTSGASADPWAQQSFGPGTEKTRHVGGQIDTDFGSTTVDVILRPSRTAALRTVDVETIYGAEIVLKDQPVIFQDQNGQGFTPAPTKPPTLMKSIGKLLRGGT